MEDFAPDTVTGGVASGMYDRRRGKGIGLVTVDVQQLKSAVEANDATAFGGDASQKPENWWNGVVYVRLPDAGGGRAVDSVVKSVDGWGVKVVNGSSIPDPSFADDSGMTVATNNVMYVQGHFNADGDPSTGTSQNPDNNVEPPAALVADAITVLSPAWQDELSNCSDLNSCRKSANFVEVSAAFLTGLAPSDKFNNNRYSGGVENFPRFLEGWGGRTVRYRGSMVALFESEIAKEPWGTSSVYAAPNRDWGYNSLFAQGAYPPGTPNTRNTRRFNFRVMTQDEWNQEMAQLRG
ncbi:MAG: hypothetical protein HC841_04285, partial [Verrucomicrobiae bacterium]|nr:hypothetical protein [Verrucomicrobiae bacterium]